MKGDIACISMSFYNHVDQIYIAEFVAAHFSAMAISSATQLDP
jgi:hypothetical protein